jgi:hypothetical protein
MNTIFSIILGVIVIVLLYLVYTYYFSSSTTISSSLWLSNNNAPVTTIANPNTSVFTYGLWIYINTWSQAPMNIFSCGTQGQTYFSLDLPTSSPTLTCTINTGTTACSQGTSQTIVITNNFGIQRWVYVLVSVNTNIVDAYLDGKLVNSTQLFLVPVTIGPSIMALVIFIFPISKDGLQQQTPQQLFHIIVKPDRPLQKYFLRIRPTFNCLLIMYHNNLSKYSDKGYKNKTI